MALEYYTPGEGSKPTIDDSEVNVLRKLALATYNMANSISGGPTTSGVVYFDPGEGDRPLIDEEEKTTLKKWCNLMFGLTGGS